MRYRYDGFTPPRRRKFFETLAKTGCALDACRTAGISRNTLSRWRSKEPGFEEEFQRCLNVAAGELERLAWDRAVNGVEEKLIKDGKIVQIKVKPSDAIFRLLLQASNPKKYGRTGRGGATRKQIEKQLRAEITRELRVKVLPRVATNAEVREALVKRLTAFGVRTSDEQQRAGESEEEG